MQAHVPINRYDWQRAARFGVVGLTLHGPFFFTGFRLLDRAFGSANSFRTVSNEIERHEYNILMTCCHLLCLVSNKLLQSHAVSCRPLQRRQQDRSHCFQSTCPPSTPTYHCSRCVRLASRLTYAHCLHRPRACGDRQGKSAREGVDKLRAAFAPTYLHGTVFWCVFCMLADVAYI